MKTKKTKLTDIKPGKKVIEFDTYFAANNMWLVARGYIKNTKQVITIKN